MDEVMLDFETDLGSGVAGEIKRHVIQIFANPDRRLSAVEVAERLPARLQTRFNTLQVILNRMVSSKVLETVNADGINKYRSRTP